MGESADPLDKIRRSFRERSRKYGYDPRALWMTGKQEQLLRMEVLADIEPNWENQSVLDVGCGFCDLVDVLRLRGFSGRYVGVDITDEVIKIARKRHPDLEIINRDIMLSPFSERFDYVFASGTFNLIFCEDMLGFVSKILQAMFEHSIIGVGVNYQSTYVDYQHPEAHHTDPAWIFNEAKNLTKRVLLRHDYMPYEFAIYLWRDDRVRPGNVFAAYDSEA